MRITVPGHNFTTSDRIWVATGAWTGTGDPNVTDSTAGNSSKTPAVITAVSGNDVTYTTKNTTGTGTFSKDPLYDWSAWGAFQPTSDVQSLYKNTVYTSGGTITLTYPASGNVTLTHSGGSNKSVIVASGQVGGVDATKSRLRFINGTGPTIEGGGTNARLMSTTGYDFAASTSSTSPGVLITKATTGQPDTTINATGTNDAFADALRNGAIAVDTSSNRGYFYANGWKYAALTTPSDSRLKTQITSITGALDKLKQLIPVAFKWKRPEAHGRTEAVDDDGERLGFIADQVATTDLKYWVETLGVDDRETDLVDTPEVLAVNIPQNEMEALVVQALIDIDTRLKALEER